MLTAKVLMQVDKAKAHQIGSCDMLFYTTQIQMVHRRLSCGAPKTHRAQAQVIGSVPKGIRVINSIVNYYLSIRKASAETSCMHTITATNSVHNTSKQKQQYKIISIEYVYKYKCLMLCKLRSSASHKRTVGTVICLRLSDGDARYAHEWPLGHLATVADDVRCVLCR